LRRLQKIEFQKSSIIRAERKDKLGITSNQNLGFSVYKLSESNFKIWRSDIQGKEHIAGQLLDFVQSEKLHSEHDYMFTELCLKSGLGLNVKHTIDNGFYKTDKLIWFCFNHYQDSMKNEILKNKPHKVVFLNSSFRNDMELSNLQLEIKENKIDLQII
jgi:adenine-specific DNA-methyltransferase